MKNTVAITPPFCQLFNSPSYSILYLYCNPHAPQYQNPPRRISPTHNSTTRNTLYPYHICQPQHPTQLNQPHTLQNYHIPTHSRLQYNHLDGICDSTQATNTITKRYSHHPHLSSPPQSSPLPNLPLNINPL